MPRFKFENNREWSKDLHLPTELKKGWKINYRKVPNGVLKEARRASLRSWF